MKLPKIQRSTFAPLVAGLFAHVLALRNGFVLDDFTLVVQNPYVRTFAGLKELLTSSLFAAAGDPTMTDYYRPAAGALNWLSWQLFKDGHAGQHGLNVFLHLVITALVLDVLVRGKVRRDVALIAATLFAVHPATTDIVAYVGGRHDMLGWLVVLAALRFVLGGASRVASAIACGLALVVGAFSREAFLGVAAVLPVAVALRGPEGRVDRRSAGFALAGIVGGVAIVSLARRAVGVAWNQPRESSVPQWIEAAGGFLARMLHDLFAPTDLVVDLDTPHLGVPLSLLLLVAFAATLPLAWRAVAAPQRALQVFGHVSLFATVIVHTPAVLRFDFLSDRYAYPFVLGATLALAPLAEAASGALARRLDKSPLLVVLPKVPWLVALALVPLTWSRVVTWRDESSLQRDMYTVRPDDPHSKLAEGSRLLADGDAAGALPLCTAYADRYPRTSRPELCIGLALRRLGRNAEAVPHLVHYAQDHLGNLDARLAAFDTMFLAGDLAGVEAAVAPTGWAAPVMAEPDMVAAKKELARRRSLVPHPP